MKATKKSTKSSSKKHIKNLQTICIHAHSVNISTRKSKEIRTYPHNRHKIKQFGIKCGTIVNKLPANPVSMIHVSCLKCLNCKCYLFYCSKNNFSKRSNKLRRQTWGCIVTQILTSTKDRKRLYLSSLVRISPTVKSANLTQEEEDIKFHIVLYCKGKKLTAVFQCFSLSCCLSFFLFLFLGVFREFSIICVFTHLFITRGGVTGCDGLVYYVNDPIGCWQVLLDDRVQFSGVVQQDEPLKQE